MVPSNMQHLRRPLTGNEHGSDENLKTSPESEKCVLREKEEVIIDFTLATLSCRSIYRKNSKKRITSPAHSAQVLGGVMSETQWHNNFRGQYFIAQLTLLEGGILFRVPCQSIQMATAPDRCRTGYTVHCAAPFERPQSPRIVVYCMP